MRNLWKTQSKVRCSNMFLCICWWR